MAAGVKIEPMIERHVETSARICARSFPTDVGRARTTLKIIFGASREGVMLPLTATLEGEPVGLIVAQKNPAPKDHEIGTWATINLHAVHPALRDRQIGQTLAEELEKAIKQKWMKDTPGVITLSDATGRDYYRRRLGYQTDPNPEKADSPFPQLIKHLSV
jgi:predicted N-acetyltransferase YhbS